MANLSSGNAAPRAGPNAVAARGDQAAAPQPGHVRGLQAARILGLFLRDPIEVSRRVHARHGSLVFVHNPLPVPPNLRAGLFAAGGRHTRAILSAPQAWRSVSVTAVGRRDTAVRRITKNIISMNGRQHAHYRRLVAPPLKRGNIDGMGAAMVEIADREISGWPVGEPFDLWPRVGHLLRTFAIALLFGGKFERGYELARHIDGLMNHNWSLATAACPVDLPFTGYGKMSRHANRAERCILDWGMAERGGSEAGLLSLIVNSPAPDGGSPSDETVVGQIPVLFAAAYETCQAGLLWSLVALAQHPDAARRLVAELTDAFGSQPPDYDRLIKLPWLDAVVKESMRVLPPVPAQFRVALGDTSVSGVPVARGTRAVLSSYITNRDPAVYAEPDRFRPERWQDAAPSPFEIPVFSAGPRICPGFWFGTNVVKTALALLISRYRLRLAPQRIDYRVRVALMPVPGVTAMLEPQDMAFAAAPLTGGIARLLGAQA